MVGVNLTHGLAGPEIILFVRLQVEAKVWLVCLSGRVRSETKK